ncbi:MAG: conserved rane protein of unknown function [Nitrospira sp.]|jgi:hypothetical protein|nr:conserved rane protein of unknown function [Nitrospira sp.]
MEVNLFVLKLGLISVWGLWIFIAFLTNLFDGLKVMRRLPPYWKFASDNFQAVAQATALYHAPPWFAKILFLGVLLWQSLALICFGRAIVSSWTEGSPAWGSVNAAFAASLGLLAAFMIADEIFKQYDVERAHVLLFIGQLVTLIALYVLPA